MQIIFFDTSKCTVNKFIVAFPNKVFTCKPFDKTLRSIFKPYNFEAMLLGRMLPYITPLDSAEHLIEIIRRKYTSYHPKLFSALLDFTLKPRLFH
jgi:hypothetical protein